LAVELLRAVGLTIRTVQRLEPKVIVTNMKNNKLNSGSDIIKIYNNKKNGKLCKMEKQ
jgi:hypothetical protein